MNAYWRAANYLSVGQIYLKDNPLLRRPLRRDDIKSRLLGHWGTCPGLNFVYVHLNRVIKARDLNLIYVCGPGHGGPAMVANVYLEGTYSEYYAHISRERNGAAAALQAVLVPGGHPQPRGRGDARLDQRGRGAGLLTLACLRGRVRQSRSHRLLRDRRRGGRDRSAGRLLAFEQVPQPGHRRRRAADPPSQRLQDRQPHHPRPDRQGGVGRVPAGLRLHALFRRGGRSGPHAPVDGGHPRPSARRDQGVPARRPGGGRHRAPALADDRAGHAQGLDRAEDRGRTARPRGRSGRTRSPSRT